MNFCIKAHTTLDALQNGCQLKLIIFIKNLNNFAQFKAKYKFPLWCNLSALRTIK
jgi:hypothetical protein